MRIIMVTRHTALVQYAIEVGIVPPDVEVLPHITEPEEIAGCHVVGPLPLHLAARAYKVTHIPINYPRDGSLRGVELTLEQLREIAGAPETYVVRREGEIRVIEERGNGFPGPGAYVPGDNGSLYRVVSSDGRIETGETAGASNWIRARVVPVNWSDCPEGQEFRAIVILDEGQNVSPLPRQSKAEYRLAFEGSALAYYFPQFEQEHNSLQSACQEARRVYAALSWGLRDVHRARVYGPGLGDDGMRLR